MSTIDWNTTPAAIWRPHTAHLHPVVHTDPITLDVLSGIDRQKSLIVRNTQRFVDNKTANNALLWGARGTGKSSLIKALLNHFFSAGLRIIEIEKNDMIHLTEIVDSIRNCPQKFIIFCDDLSFEDDEPQYKTLKSVMEGSIEIPPENVLIYATSNRRHLLPESMQDNLKAEVVNNVLHPGEAIEEKISLSDRFGLWLSFYPVKQDGYLDMIYQLFPDVKVDKDKLRADALRFAHERGNRSGRTAKHFYNSYSGEYN